MNDLIYILLLLIFIAVGVYLINLAFKLIKFIIQSITNAITSKHNSKRDIEIAKQKQQEDYIKMQQANREKQKRIDQLQRDKAMREREYALKEQQFHQNKKTYTKPYTIIRCEPCGARLNIRDNSPYTTCDYCGTKVIVDTFNKQINYTTKTTENPTPDPTPDPNLNTTIPYTNPSQPTTDDIQKYKKEANKYKGLTITFSILFFFSQNFAFVALIVPFAILWALNNDKYKKWE